MTISDADLWAECVAAQEANNWQEDRQIMVQWGYETVRDNSAPLEGFSPIAFSVALAIEIEAIEAFQNV